MMSFEQFGGTDADDDSGNVTDPYRKPYRSLIASNAITTFDLYVYLFARQCQFLQLLERPLEILQRAMSFMNTMYAELIEHRVR